jgi:hypothetical protein
MIGRVPRQPPRKRDEPQQHLTPAAREHVAYQNAVPKIDPAYQASSQRDHLVRRDRKPRLKLGILQASRFHGPGIGLGRVEVELVCLSITRQAEAGEDVLSGRVSSTVHAEIIRQEQTTWIQVRNTRELGFPLINLIHVVLV